MNSADLTPGIGPWYFISNTPTDTTLNRLYHSARDMVIDNFDDFALDARHFRQQQLDTYLLLRK